MANYIVELSVVVRDIESDDDYFHQETVSYLLETGRIESAEVQSVREL